MSDIHWGGSVSESGQIQVLQEQLTAERAKVQAVRDLVQGWMDDAGPDSHAENVFGQQVISVGHIHKVIMGLIDA
ncbi:hypothetical protein J4U02_gp080 [Mycobacterium phage Aziz]|uniref:Uncharacterized protein n=1 Tax=Mycobacterium phage Aziz TaxID=2762281 RepID=A0A7G8LHL8_9CAUD|nr:hypothetical protein J4U02_gp080 [Mycobacterium phage Aziz]ASR75928.1 hypothetical protein SEA_GENEVAB15_82 [Mycobacterium phage GenevaB15]QNJ56740.1 hypothetical protein SEA_AZIZ_80 [Mycobacterium phage Aziz]